MKTAVPILITFLLILSACGQSGNKENPADGKGASGQGQGTIGGEIKPEDDSKVVAKVNGVPIYEDELNGLPVNSLVTDEILYQKGLSEGIEKKYQDRVRQYQMSMVVREIKDQIIKDMPPEKKITDEELLNYYNSAKDLNYTNTRVEEINFTDKQLGEKILKMAKEGKDFDEIVKELPSNETETAAVKVTQLGYDRKQNIYFKVIEVGAVSDIVDKKNGTYSVLKIQEIHVIPFESARNTIRYIVEARRKKEAYDAYAQKVAKEKNYDVEIVK